MKHSSA